jgi:protein O-mannosyl-transferase
MEMQLMRPNLANWLKDNAGIIALLAVSLIVYGTGFTGEFVVDDNFILKDNPYLAGNDLARFFSHGFWESTVSQGSEAAMYRPFALVFFWFAHKLWGTSPTGYHIALTLIHLANTCLVYAVARKLLSASAIAATLGAAVFALHPARVESVAWISGAPDPLALFFLLAALLAHHAYSGDPGKWRYLMMAAASFQLALWSKEAALAFPLIVVAHDLLFRKKINWPSAILYVALAAGYLICRSLALSGSGLLSNHNPAQFTRALDLTAGYAEWLVFPRQVPFYLQPPQHALATLISGCALLLILLFIPAAWRFSGEAARKPLAFSLVWAIGFSWIAVLMMFYLEGYISARFLYVPSAGMAFFVAACYDGLIARHAKLKKPVLVLLSVAIAAYGVVTLREISFWHDDVTAYRRVTQASPGGTVGFINLGYILIDKGDFAGAEENFQSALRNARIPRVKAEALVALGTASAMKNELMKSENYFVEATRTAPENYLAWAGLGNIAFMEGRAVDAISCYEKSLSINPKNYEATMNLANAYVQNGQLERAAMLRDAAQHLPGCCK